MFNQSQKKNKAFVSIIAILLANVFLVIGISVFSISLREIVISGGLKDSSIAFYGVDTGMECALYWDIKEKIFSTSTAPVVGVNCGEQDALISFYKDCGLDCSRNIFELNYPSGSCAQVELFKLADGSTVIKSFGQNTCDVNRKNRVERAWQVSY